MTPHQPVGVAVFIDQNQLIAVAKCQGVSGLIQCLDKFLRRFAGLKDSGDFFPHFTRVNAGTIAALHFPCPRRFALRGRCGMTEDFFQSPRYFPFLELCPFQLMGFAGNGVDNIENEVEMLFAVFPMLDHGTLMPLKPICSA